MTELPPSENWLYYPLFVTTDPDASGDNLVVTGFDSNESCPIGKPFEFESDLFKGKLLIRIRNLETSLDRETDNRYFDGKKRKNNYVIQGRFKKEVSADNLIWGTEYKKPMKLPPPPLIEKLTIKVLKRINPAMKMKLCGENPFVLTNFPGAMQILRADSPGNEPDISYFYHKENNSAFGKNQTSGGKTVFPKEIKERKRFFSNPKLSKEVVFNTDTVYTFDHYDNFFDLKNNEINIGFSKRNLTKITDEPVGFMLKDMSTGKYLWSFQFWHKDHLES